MPDKNEKDAMVGVEVLIYDGDRILLEKRGPDTHGANTWCPPGGHIQYGETPEQTAIRETREETDVTISDVKFRAVTNDIFEADQQQFITLWFDAKYISGDAKVNAPDEITEVGWFTWDSLPEPLFLSLRNLLEGKTYPSQTTEEKLGAAIENSQTETIHESRL